MSYEGRVQHICANGHYSETDAYMSGFKCESCGQPSAWSNSVDDTNCDEAGIIPQSVLREKFLVSEQVVETCNLGHPHVTQPEVFRVPMEEETGLLRHYWDYKKDVYVPYFPKVIP